MKKIASKRTVSHEMRPQRHQNTSKQRRLNFWSIRTSWFCTFAACELHTKFINSKILFILLFVGGSAAAAAAASACLSLGLHLCSKPHSFTRCLLKLTCCLLKSSWCMCFSSCFAWCVFFSFVWLLVFSHRKQHIYTPGTHSYGRFGETTTRMPHTSNGSFARKSKHHNLKTYTGNAAKHTKSKQ